MIPDNVEKIIMTKEDYDRNVEQLLYDKINAEQEVERLRLELSGYRQAILQDKEMLGLKQEIERIKELSKVDSQQGQQIIVELSQEIERLHSIIKEVREYIEEHIAMFKNGDMLVDMNINEFLEILDEVDKNES